MPWKEKRRSVEERFLSLLRDEAAPEPPGDFQLEIEREWDGGGFRIQYISYQVEADERAYAYLAVPDGPIPDGGFPGVVVLHGTTTWGACRTLGLLPESGDPHASKSMEDLDYARLGFHPDADGLKMEYTPAQKEPYSFFTLNRQCIVGQNPKGEEEVENMKKASKGGGHDPLPRPWTRHLIQDACCWRTVNGV